MQPQSKYTTVRPDTQTGQGAERQLSIQAKLELRAKGLGYFSYLCDVLFSKYGSEIEGLTAKEVAELAGWNPRTVSRTLARAGELLPQIVLISTELVIISTKSGKNSSRGRKAQRYTILDSADINTQFSIAEPLYMNVRLDTYMNYKADISQWLIVDKPGAHGAEELAKSAHVHRNTQSRHRKIAETKSFPQKVSTPVMSRDTLPETYGDYLELCKRKEPYSIMGRKILPGMRLEFAGISDTYTQRGYDRHERRGGTPETIKLVYYKKSHHFARLDLKLTAPKYGRYNTPFVDTKKYCHVPAYLSPDIPAALVCGDSNDMANMPAPPADDGYKRAHPGELTAMQRILAEKYGAYYSHAMTKQLMEAE